MLSFYVITYYTHFVCKYLSLYIIIIINKKDFGLNEQYFAPINKVIDFIHKVLKLDMNVRVLMF